MKLFFALFFLTILGTASAQKSEIFNVKFILEHSRRISNNHVSVDFRHFGDSIRAYVKCIPMDTSSPKWKETILDTSFQITVIEFENIIASVRKINCNDIINGAGYCGKDGYYCEIEMGICNSISYKVWSPEYNTKERNLQAYLNAAKLIIIAAKLDPNKIL